MAQLWPHQQEVAALARVQSAALSCPQRVGKTFLSSWLLVEAIAPNGVKGKHNRPRHAIAVAPTPAERAALKKELARLCGLPVVCSDDGLSVEDAKQAANRWWISGSGASSAPAQVSILSPTVLLEVLRNNSGGSSAPIAPGGLALLVVEGFDQVYAELPAFFPALFQHFDQARATETVSHGANTAESDAVRVFVTTRQSCSKLNWRAGGNPLFGRIQVLNMIPASAPDASTLSFPPILCEPFAQTESKVPKLDVKSFLLGANSKKVDLVGVYRRELELGNSKANMDDKLKQDRVTRFIADAEVVHEHLGLWCMWKFVELELQTNLLACTIVDPSSKKSKRNRVNSGGDVVMDGSSDEVADPEEGEVIDTGTNDEDDSDDGRLFARVLGPDVQLDPMNRAKIKPIVKVIKWVGAQAAKCGTDAASPRLLKTANVLRVRFQNSRSAFSEDSIRAWVFVVRRCHCRVVAEYLWAALAELQVSAPCSMLGNSSARVCGSPHFSSQLKVMKMFDARESTILVTTSMKRASPDDRIQPPSCDVVVVMDELLEPVKLFDVTSRADGHSGVVVYVTGESPPEMKKFEVLKLKMEEYARQLEADRVGVPAVSQPGNDVVMTESADASAVVTSAATPSGSTALTTTPSRATATTLPLPLPSYASQQRMDAQSASEIRYADTGAVLNVSNSVNCLSSFCDTLPGLDTYDRHPEYKVKRIPVTASMSEGAKRYKKKKLKYNSKLNDKIDELAATAAVAAGGDEDAENAADDESESRSSRFHYSAALRLPNCLGIRKQFVSPKVETEAEAKGICAFHACQEIIRKGLLDRNFRSKLIDDESTIHRDLPTSDAPATSSSGPGSVQEGAESVAAAANPALSKQSQQLADMSTQNSYDLPPVSAAELSLRPIRSLTQEAAAASTARDDDWTATMCFYALEGVRFAILATDELYTGNTNMGWRYDFAMCGVMDGELRRLTLQKRPTKLALTKQQLHDALHFHLVTMRLACMTVADAVRDIDIVGENVWNEFSEQNDKGYLVAPSVLDSASNTFSLDWDYVHEIIHRPLLEPAWPLPSVELLKSEWVCVPEHRRNVTYVVEAITDEKIPDICAKYMPDEETWATHIKRGKSTPGNPILGRWHSRDMLEQAEDDQPLIYGIQVPQIVPLIRRVMQRNLDEGSIAKLSTKHNERLLIPQYTQRLRLSKSRFFEAMGIVPVLYEFERKCQISNLMTRIGLEVDMTLLDDATTKPAYERFEILGDTFLKLETTWFMFENRKDIIQEGFLTQLRRDIIRNDRLNQFAICARLHHYILYPAEVEQHPFKCWKPSCMGKTPEPVVAPAKWVADVLEAICGAYLIGQGEKGARHFLRWVGVSVLEEPHTFARPFYPDCFPNELYDDDVQMTDARTTHPLSLNFSVAQFEDLPKRLMTLQQRLKYTFRNKRLLLEAVTHPSIGQLVLHVDQMDMASQGGDTNGDIAVPTSKQSKKKAKSVWKGDYERLEYLGDAIIEYLTLSYAFLTHDKWLPGSLSQWKSATVSNDALGKTALAWFGVDECILAGAVRIDAETMERVARIDRMYAPSSLSSLPTHGKSKRSAAANRGQVTNHTLPKMFADVFEALVAAVFLDSGRDLQQVRDVFMWPLLETVGKDAFAYVCHESGLAVDNLGDELMEELSFSSDLD